MRKVLILFIIIINLINPVLSQNNNEYKRIINNARLEVINGKYKMGILSFDSALQVSPTSLIIYKDRGYAEMQLKKYDKAIEDFTIILKNNSNAIDVSMQRGIAYYHINKIDSAFVDIQKVLSDNPYHREAKEYMRYVVSAKKLIETNNLNQLKTEQLKIEQIRIEKASEREKIIKGSKNPLSFWYSVFETW